MVANPGRTAVYRSYDAAGRLLYVGVAEIPEVRWKQHARTSPWWPDVSGTPHVNWYDLREDAEAAELVAIRTEAPLHNIVGTPEHGRRMARPANGTPRCGPYMGAAEIGERLGVSRQRVQQLVARPDFPKPSAELAMGKVWRAEDIEAWIVDHRPDIANPAQ